MLLLSFCIFIPQKYKRLIIYFFLPKLSICILADGLYTTGPFFDICEEHNWFFIVVFKDTQLKTVWQQVEQEQEEQPNNKDQEEEELPQNRIRYKSFQWVNRLIYQGHTLNWAEANIEDQKTVNSQTQCLNKHRFVCLTNLKIDKTSVQQIVEASRLRWKIENEGFKYSKKWRL